MNVKELIKELSAQAQTAKVIIASDAEGNSIHTLETIECDEKVVLLWPSDSEIDINTLY